MGGELRIDLSEGFRFVHEPLLGGSEAQGARFVARQPAVEDLAARIRLSSGGAFLITGYRGVGKTTFVHRVVDAVRRQVEDPPGGDGPTRVVDVALSVTRPTDGVELMHHLLVGLHQRLAELGLLRSLAPDLQRDLELARQRTMLSIAFAASDEREGELEAGGGPGLGALLKLFELKLAGRRKRGRSQSFSYLGYDEKAAEHDLIRICRRLCRPVEAPRESRWRARPRSAPTRLKVVFVLDELDKIEDVRAPDPPPGAPAEGITALDQILANLKNLFTTSGVSFLFVAGRGLLDRWVDDLRRGNSLYESIFTYSRYLPALWEDVDEMCDAFVASAGAEERARLAFHDFKGYLKYKGRGIPRRVMSRFNKRVLVDGRGPFLHFTPQEVRRYRFYGELDAALRRGEDELLGDGAPLAKESVRDQHKLALYHLTDWILRRGRAPFSLEEAIAASQDFNAMIAPPEELAPELVERLLRVLVRAQYLEPVAEEGTQVRVRSVHQSGPGYRVAERRLLEMGGTVDFLDQEVPERTPGEAAIFRASPYAVLEQIGRGGMGTVYRALEKSSGRVVALKYLDERHAADEQMQQLFAREPRLLERLAHPNVVRLLGSHLDAAPRFYVMEHLDGVSLARVLGRPAEPGAVVAVARGLLAALDHVHGRGVVHRDVKPWNVRVPSDGRVVLMDFGIAAEFGAAARASGVEGTPAYMSPEQARGLAQDARSDLYSCGVLLYQLATGRLPFRADNPQELMRLHVSEPAPPPELFAEIPAALSALLLRCLEKDPDARCASAAAALDELAGLEPVDDLAGWATERAREAPGGEVAESATHLAPATMHGAVPAPVPQPVPEPEPVGSAPGATHPSPPPPPPPPPPPLPRVPTAGAPRPARGAPTLRWDLDGPHELTLEREPVGLGRHPQNDVVLAHESVSRFHAQIERGDEGWTVEELNSMNGLTVNGERTRRALLRSGDRIGIGQVELEVSLEGDGA